MVSVPSGLDEMAERQEGVLSRAQLGELGETRHRIRSEVRARRWQVVDGAVVLHRGPRTLSQRI